MTTSTKDYYNELPSDVKASVDLLTESDHIVSIKHLYLDKSNQRRFYVTVFGKNIDANFCDEVIGMSGYPTKFGKSHIVAKDTLSESTVVLKKFNKEYSAHRITVIC